MLNITPSQAFLVVCHSTTSVYYYYANGRWKQGCNDDFTERVRNRSMEKFRDSAEIRTQDFLNSSQILLPLGPLAEELNFKTSYIKTQSWLITTFRTEPLRVAKFSQGSTLWEWESVGIRLRPLENAACVACLPLVCQGSKWLNGKSVWLVFRRSWVRILAGSWNFFHGFISHSQ